MARKIKIEIPAEKSVEIPKEETKSEVVCPNCNNSGRACSVCKRGIEAV